MLKLFLIGFIGGVLSGILGIGGGIVFVPLLTYFTKEDFKINTGISSLAIVFVASASAISYITNGIEISNYVLYRNRYSPYGNSDFLYRNIVF